MTEHDEFNGISLGDKVRDVITGFEGTVTGAVAYLTGCNQVLVNAGCKDAGEEPKTQWFDAERCTVIGEHEEAKRIAGRRMPDRGADLLPPIR